MCGLFWGAHKSLAPRARTLLGGLGQATLSFFAVATLLFVFFGECPKFCDLAKQRRKIVQGVSEVGKDDFLLYFFWRCVIFLVFYFSSAAIARLAPAGLISAPGWTSVRPEGTQPQPATSSRRPDGRVRAPRVCSPCRLQIAAIWMDECAPRSKASHTQPTAQHTERAHR